MNYPTLYGQQVQANSCGPTALLNREAAFWQSRTTTAARGVAPLHPVVDLRALAQAVRATFIHEEAPQC